LKGIYYVTVVIHSNENTKSFEIHEKGFWFIVKSHKIENLGSILFNTKWE
ncbi:hypothetical protein HN415_06705, partial [Candidatus Woesearchaeota archaeon]|nr:hypothetical protein [Candidatus Woesearchaeota archaeon]